MSDSDKLHCHRCGWTGERRDLDHNWHGDACPKCPEYRDDDASLSVVEKQPTAKVFGAACHHEDGRLYITDQSGNGNHLAMKGTL